jgi:triacylglycerol lipase
MDKGIKRESFGWIMAKCSEAAYLSGKEAKPLYKGLGFNRHKYFDKSGAQAHAAYDNEWFVLSFRGTEVKSWSDIKADLNVDSVEAKYSYGKVHKGFEKEVDKLWSHIRDYVLKQCKDRKLIVTGHSLGASMATIVAARLKTAGWNVNGLYTYGSPRVGNESFKKSLDVPHYRFVNNSDDVTKMPFYHWGYRHHGELRYINSKGTVELGTNIWRRTLDRLAGRWSGFKNKDYFDGLSDHSITGYADNLLEYTEGENGIR